MSVSDTVSDNYEASTTNQIQDSTQLPRPRQQRKFVEYSYGSKDQVIKEDDYEGELSLEELSYIEKWLNSDDHQPRRRIHYRIATPRTNDTIEGYEKATKNCFNHKNFNRALTFCANGLLLSSETNDLPAKMRLCNYLGEISDHLKSSDDSNRIVKRFLENVNSKLNDVVKDFSVEFNDLIRSSGFHKNEEKGDDVAGATAEPEPTKKDFQTIFLNWAIRKGYLKAHTNDESGNNYSQLQCWDAMLKFQKEILDIIPPNSPHGAIILLKIINEIGADYDTNLKIKALKVAKSIFKDHDDHLGLMRTYTLLEKIYEDMEKYEKLGHIII